MDIDELYGPSAFSLPGSQQDLSSSAAQYADGSAGASSSMLNYGAAVWGKEEDEFRQWGEGLRTWGEEEDFPRWGDHLGSWDEQGSMMPQWGGDDPEDAYHERYWPYGLIGHLFEQISMHAQHGDLSGVASSTAMLVMVAAMYLAFMAALCILFVGLDQDQPQVTRGGLM